MNIADFVGSVGDGLPKKVIRCHLATDGVRMDISAAVITDNTLICLAS